MASIIKVKGKWRAQIRRKGSKPITKTFMTKALAEAWAKKVEAEVEAGNAGIVTPKGVTTLADVIERYTLEVGEKKPFGKNKAWVLSRLASKVDGLGAHPISTLSTEVITDYILNTRQITGVTALVELTYLSGVLKVARALWRIHAPAGVVEDAREILRHMGHLRRSEERDRRPTSEEIEKLRGYFAHHSRSLTVDLIDFILDSCFRPPTEIVNLKWSNLNEADRTILIEDRKDPRKKLGNNMVVPLLGRCMEIIKRQPRIEGEDRIFPKNGKSWSSLFPKACKPLGIENLTLYDLRHEAISRLVETGKYSFPEMMLITGHKDPKQLMRYTQLQARDLHR